MKPGPDIPLRRFLAQKALKLGRETLGRQYLLEGDLLTVGPDRETFQDSVLRLAVQGRHGLAAISSDAFLPSQSKQPFLGTEEALSPVGEMDQLTGHGVVHTVGNILKRILVEMDSARFPNRKKI